MHEFGTMSQFVSTSDLWKHRAMKFAGALIAVMDGMKDHEIEEYTGLNLESCMRIANARAFACDLLDGVQS